jgi:hypothetical protein
MKRMYLIPLATLALLLVAIPALGPEPVEHKQRAWTKQDSLAYANDRLVVWSGKQMTCLSRLWGKESAWNPKAKNKHSTAFGIPKMLKLDNSLSAAQQIDRGLSYIYYRYDTPCNAWKHWQRKKWY